LFLLTQVSFPNKGVGTAITSYNVNFVSSFVTCYFNVLFLLPVNFIPVLVSCFLTPRGGVAVYLHSVSATTQKSATLIKLHSHARTKSSMHFTVHLGSYREDITCQVVNALDFPELPCS
jgi:hypothetical protein